MRAALTLALLLAPFALAQPRRVVPLSEGGKRWGLVVGNDAYTAAHPLRNAVNDARGMAAVLRQAGFTLTVVENATRESLDRGVTQFVNQLRTGDVALFFYSGHGIQIAGENYLIPVDLAALDEAQVRYRSVNANEILERMEAHGAALNVIVLDACRDNPFRGMRSAGGGGLALMNGGDGTLLAYATAPGKTADDNALSGNGLYTGYLVQALREPGLTLEQVFKRAGDLVKRQSNGAQIPFYTSSVSGDFYFFPAGGVPAPPGNAIETLPRPGAVPGARQTKINPKDGLTYVWIDPGTFQMGCSPGDSECADHEKPAHAVTLTKGFWMGQTPVTVGAFSRYAKATDSTVPILAGPSGSRVNAAARNDTVPIVMINWDKAAAYCSWAGMRLPTDAEWEFSARAGTAGVRYGNLDDIAWYGDNSGRTPLDSAALSAGDPKEYFKRVVENGNAPKPVAQKMPNPWGLYDMIGNVEQWTADVYDRQYYQASEPRDPSGPPSGGLRSLRGSSWLDPPRQVRVSRRDYAPPGSQGSARGFRCAGN